MRDLATILNEIKTFTMSKYSFFNTGFANVHKPNNTDVVIDGENKEYRGICDHMGAYFYLRSLKNTTYTNPKRGGRIQFLEANTTCRMVAVAPKADADVMLQVLINSVCSHTSTSVSKACLDSAQVFTDETGNKEAAVDNLVLVALDFEVIHIQNAKNCELNPCEC